MRPKRRLAAFGAAFAMSATTLVGCATAQPGSAAIVGDVRIEESLVGDQMRSINEAVGAPPDTPSAQAARSIVSYNVGYELVQQTADKVQASVTPGELERVYDQQVANFGSEEELFSAAAQQGIAPASIHKDLRTQLLIQGIVSKVAPGVTDQQAQQDALIAALAEVARSIGVEVSPKYGQWDSETLQIVPPTDPVSRAVEPPAEILPTQ